MNPVWLIRNIRNHWPTRGNALDFVRCLLWIYSAKIPEVVRPRECTIGFRYPEPVGRIRLLVRANRGSDSFIHGEVFGHQYYRLPLASAPTTILDLGANSGMTAVYFGRVYPDAKLACVEPAPDNLRVLTRNMELNSTRGTVFAAAVDARDGRAIMELGPLDYGHKIADPNTGSSERTVEVRALSVPTILQQLGWQRIGLLKVDIEGHEKTLFSADCDWLERVDTMCIECHEGFGEADLRRLAERFGFLPPTRLPGIWLMTRETA